MEIVLMVTLSLGPTMEVPPLHTAPSPGPLATNSEI